MSPLSLLFCRLKNSISLSLSSQERRSSLWTLLWLLFCSLVLGAPEQMQHSRWGLTRAEQEGQNHPSQLASHASCCAGLVKNEAKDVIFICEFVPDYLGPIEKALPGQLNILGLKRLHKSSVRGRLKCLHKLETKFYLFPHL